MSTIQVHRTHDMGLPTARRAAYIWMAHVQKKYGMECRYVEGADYDMVHFTRPQASGTLRVSATEFAFTLRLGWLLSPFSASIEQAVVRNVDYLLGLWEKKKAADKAALRAQAEQQQKAPAPDAPVPARAASASSPAATGVPTPAVKSPAGTVKPR